MNMRWWNDIIFSISNEKGYKKVKQKINVEQFVNENGRYKVNNDYIFKQQFSILELKHANILQRISRINSLCSQHIYEWTERRKKWNNTNYELSFLQEEIIFHIRRAVDDMISNIWMMNEWENGRKTVKVEIDSIGRYLSRNNTQMNCFDANRDFLDMLNLISNSYKHSIYQTVLSPISAKEAGFYIYTYNKNDMRNKEQEYIYYQSDLLEEFQKMFDVYANFVYERSKR